MIPFNVSQISGTALLDLPMEITAYKCKKPFGKKNERIRFQKVTETRAYRIDDVDHYYF